MFFRRIKKSWLTTTSSSTEIARTHASKCENSCTPDPLARQVSLHCFSRECLPYSVKQLAAIKRFA